MAYISIKYACNVKGFLDFHSFIFILDDYIMSHYFTIITYEFYYFFKKKCLVV